MPTLTKFILVAGILAGLGYGALYWLANYVEPQPREITIRVPSDRFREP